MSPFLDVAIPSITFLLLTTVGLDLTETEFDRVRRRPLMVAVGLVGPLLLLPAVVLRAGMRTRRT